MNYRYKAENAAFPFSLLLQHIKSLSRYNYNLFLGEEECLSGVLPISTWGRDKFSNEPFSTSILKVPISWQISPATDLSKFSMRCFFNFFFPIDGSKWILVASLDSCWQEWRYLPSVQMHIGHGKQFRQFPNNGHGETTNNRRCLFMQLKCRQRATHSGGLLALKWTHEQNISPGCFQQKWGYESVNDQGEGIWLGLKQ